MSCQQRHLVVGRSNGSRRRMRNRASPLRGVGEDHRGGPGSPPSVDTPEGRDHTYSPSWRSSSVGEKLVNRMFLKRKGIINRYKYR